VDLGTFKDVSVARRHFFVLPEWLRPGGEPLFKVMENDGISFANVNGLSVIKGGLQFVELLMPQLNGNWRVISGSMYRKTLSSTTVNIPRSAAGERLYSANRCAEVDWKVTV
jgi:hypothetical protein